VACVSAGLSSAIADWLANEHGALAGGDGEREGQKESGTNHNRSRQVQSKRHASVSLQKRASKRVRIPLFVKSDREFLRIVRKNPHRAL